MRLGFALLSQVLDKELLEEWRKLGEAYFVKSFQILHENSHLSRTLSFHGPFVVVLALNANNSQKSKYQQSNHWS